MSMAHRDCWDVGTQVYCIFHHKFLYQRRFSVAQDPEKVVVIVSRGRGESGETLPPLGIRGEWRNLEMMEAVVLTSTKRVVVGEMMRWMRRLDEKASIVKIVLDDRDESRRSPWL
jgi:hypothetical protein